MERFYQLIEELGNILDLSLYVDSHQACQLVIEEKIAIQIELDPSGEKILLGSFLCEIPPGKFREEVLKQALMDNYSNPLETGTLSYMEKTSKLALFSYIPFAELSAEKLSDFLATFIEKGLKWKEAVEKGETHPFIPAGIKKEKPFGM